MGGGSAGGGGSSDGLDHAVAFLKQRDGLDKLLKLTRYAAKLGAYNLLLKDPASVVGGKLKGLDASTSVTRKALRLGKFLGMASHSSTFQLNVSTFCGM